jgi:sarcosine oxidase
VGLGATGSAALLAIARRGKRIIGLDRFSPPHTLGSSHGRSRIIREALYESPIYVPLVRRAYELWQALERDTGRDLLRRIGGLMLGPPDGALVQGASRSAEMHAVSFEVLNAVDIRRRFPVFQPADGSVGIFEPRAGFLDPEGCVAGALDLAVRAGADLRCDTAVTGWSGTGSGIRLVTSRGQLECGTLILAAGPWMAGFLREAAISLTVERQVMYWLRPSGDRLRFSADHLPVFIWEWERDRLFYGIPDHGAGFKVARHHEGDTVTPDAVDRRVHAGEIAEMRALLVRTIPEADGPLVEAATCLYSNTPDRHFVLGRHPREPRVLLASPCSGHGFKFASAIGEVLADLATGRTPSFDLGPFRPDRFGEARGGA